MPRAKVLATVVQLLERTGTRQAIDSADVNAYLREIAGDDFTAKDFRTWSGTVLAARALAGAAGFWSQREAKRKVVNAIESVARSLGNTKARALRVVGSTGLSPEERAVVALVSARLRRKNCTRPEHRAPSPG